MSLHTLESVLIGLAVIAIVTFRLSRWQSVAVSKLLRMPAILAVLGLVSLTTSLQQSQTGFRLDLLDLGVLGAELAIGIVVGWLLGRLTQIRTFADGTKSRLGAAGIALFLAYVGVRIGLGLLASTFGAPLAAMPAMTMFVLAVVKGVQGLMVHERVQRHLELERQGTQAEVEWAPSPGVNDWR